MPEATEAPVIMSVEKVCDKTGLSRTFIWDRIRNRELASYKIGRRVMVRMEDLDKWIQSHKRNGEE